MVSLQHIAPRLLARNEQCAGCPVLRAMHSRTLLLAGGEGREEKGTGARRTSLRAAFSANRNSTAAHCQDAATRMMSHCSHGCA